MLVFKNGIWIDVQLPEYIDPSWGVTEKSQAAYGILEGKSWIEVEALILGKEHCSPKHNKEKRRVQKESR